jgi:type III pantothenate kinase
MLLAVDIGNTSINNGIFEGKKLRKTFRIPSRTGNMEKEYVRVLASYLKHKEQPKGRVPGKIDGIIIVSVVPPALKSVEKILKSVCGVDITVVGRDADSGVRNLYKKPEQVGQDRLVNARASYDLYGGASIIVDLGTAITIDLINKNKEYMGGVIAPGAEISLKVLSERACLLPEVEIEKPGDILGRETAESMINGAVYGFSGLCDGIVRKLKKKYGAKCKVVLTGGMSPLFAPYCETIDTVDPDLTLKGLKLIYEK